MANDLIFGKPGAKDGAEDKTSFAEILDSILDTAAHPKAHYIVGYVLKDKMATEDKELNKKNLKSFIENSIINVVNHFDSEHPKENLEQLQILMTKFLKASSSLEIPKEIKQTLLVMAIDAFDVHRDEIENCWRTSRGDDWQVKDFLEHYIEALVTLDRLDTAIEKEKMQQAYVPAKDDSKQFTEITGLNVFLNKMSKRHSVKGHDKFGALISDHMKKEASNNEEYANSILETFKNKASSTLQKMISFKRSPSNKRM